MEGQIEAFAGRYCVIRYDLRGIGKTPMWRASTRTTKTCGACWTL
ncbi:MAG TPA: hypothetical protein VGB40_02910 [Rubrobacteraceae bacterium]|jgi:hypothetical protein